MSAVRLLMALVLGGCFVGAVVWIAKGRELEVTRNDPVATPKSSEGKDKLPIADEGPYPKAVVIGQAEHKFEPMLKNGTRSHVFEIRNDGEAPLKLQNWKTTCKCTLSELEDEEVPPGGTAKITLEWTPKAATESFTQQAQINTNDPDHDLVNLSVSGAVWDALQIAPEDRWDLGQFDGSRPLETTGTIYSKVLEKFDILGQESSDPRLQMSWTPMTSTDLKRLEAKSGFNLRLTMAPTEKVGAIRETMKLTTDVDSHTEMRFSVVAMQTGAVTAYRYVPPGETPPSGTKYYHSMLAVDLGTIPANEERTAWYGFNLSKEAVEPKILSVESPVDYVSVKIEKRDVAADSAQQPFVLTIHVPKDAPPVTHQKETKLTLLVKTNVPKAEEIKFLLAFVKFES